MQLSIRLKSLFVIGALTAMLAVVVTLSYVGSTSTLDELNDLQILRKAAVGVADLESSLLQYRRAARLATEGVADPGAPSVEDRLTEFKRELAALLKNPSGLPEADRLTAEMETSFDELHGANSEAIKVSQDLRAKGESIARADLTKLYEELVQAGQGEAIRIDADLSKRWDNIELSVFRLVPEFLIAQGDTGESARAYVQEALAKTRSEVKSIVDGLPKEAITPLIASAREHLDEIARLIDAHQAKKEARDQLVDVKVLKEAMDFEQLASRAKDVFTDALASETDALRAATDRTRDTALIIGVIALVLAFCGLMVFFRTVLAPLDRSIDALEVLGEGDADLTKTLPETGDKELVRLAKAFNRFAGSMAKEIRQIVALSQRLSGIVQRFNGLSQSLSETSEATRSRAEAASNQATDVDGSMQSISAAVEEMTASISEIASHSSNSQDLSHRVASMAAEANQQIKRLGTSSSEIGEVVKVITSIAEQTNLLALNATIESARAGEAGRGFAVVANEVKELAKGTGEATGDISRKVEAIQADTKAAIEVIERIAQMIDQVTEAATTIAAAVQEQSATSGEISQSVHRAAKGTNGILDDVRQVTDAAGRAGRVRDELLGAAREIASSSTELQGVVGRYKL